ncbi:MAG: thermonuclease family protein [Verrucomicrobiales bacterium]
MLLWNRTHAPVGADRSEGEFIVLGAVRLVENRGNDGDSFHIQHGTQVRVYRLHFVDTFEKSDRFYSRLKDQGSYFGGLNPDQVIKMGEEATETTLDWLRHEPFEVYTKEERVMNSDRLHAMIRFPQASEGRQWLSERLVEAGLARIYTNGTTLADGTSAKEFEAHLRDIEADAKKAKHGAWRL